MLAAAKPHFHLDERLRKINFQRHEGIALFVDFAGNFGYLVLVQQKFSVAPRFARVERAALVVHGDVHIL